MQTRVSARRLRSKTEDDPYGLILHPATTSLGGPFLDRKHERLGFSIPRRGLTATPPSDYHSFPRRHEFLPPILLLLLL
jgi:hypothetical protein